MSHKVAVTIKMLEYANSTEICQETLIDTIKHMQELEENETGTPCSWLMAKNRVIQELLDEVDQVKSVIKMLEEPED